MGKILNREAAKRRQKSSDLSPFHGELCGDGGLHTCRLALTLVADVDFSLMGVKATLLDRPRTLQVGVHYERFLGVVWGIWLPTSWRLHHPSCRGEQAIDRLSSTIVLSSDLT